MNLANAVGVFVDKNVGQLKRVTGSGFTYSGPDAHNYSLTQPSNMTADISQRTLTISARPNVKVYDGTTAAATIPAVIGLQGDDTATGVIEAYSSNSVGSDKAVDVVGYTINDGNGGNNYLVVTEANHGSILDAAGSTPVATTTGIVPASSDVEIRVYQEVRVAVAGDIGHEARPLAGLYLAEPSVNRGVAVVNDTIENFPRPSISAGAPATLQTSFDPGRIEHVIILERMTGAEFVAVDNTLVGIDGTFSFDSVGAGTYRVRIPLTEKEALISSIVVVESTTKLSDVYFPRLEAQSRTSEVAADSAGQSSDQNVAQPE